MYKLYPGTIICNRENVVGIPLVYMVLLFLLASLVVLLPDIVFAQVPTLGSTIGRALCDIAAAVTGTVGSGLGTLAVIFLGIGSFFGKVSWALAVQVGVGIAVIFGAAEIVTVLAVVNTSGGCGGGGGLPPLGDCCANPGLCIPSCSGPPVCACT